MIFGMVAAIEMYLDPVSSIRIRKLWDAMEDAGVPSLRELTHRRHRPHISLAAAPILDPDAVAAALRGITVAPPLRLNLNFVGTFVGRVLWLGPAVTSELLAHQETVHRALEAGGVEIDPLYHPGTWVPHCTVSMRVPLKLMTDALRLCMDVLPMEVTITSAAVADYARDIHRPL
jgi:2'-5' RNA ligase